MANRNITLKNKKSVLRLDNRKLTQIDQPKVGFINLIEHEIMIREDAIPFREKSYKRSAKVMKALYEEVDRLIEKGYIVEGNSDSEWLSQPRMVKTKNDDWIFCVNYSKLNSHSYKWDYPVHSQWKIIQKLRNARRISIFKIQEAFHQIQLKRESRKYTAFEVKDRGVYEWVRMPYGLRGASATYRYAIDQFKKSISERINLLHPNIHVDDKIFVCLETWIIISDTFEEHMILIEALFEELREGGLTTDQKNTHIATERIEYFGFTIDYDGLHVNQESIKPIINFPRPKNLRKIRQFNSMVHRYRNHLKNIAIIQEPLNKFCATKAVWKWTELEEESFQKTKQALLNASSLSMLNYNLPFRLYTYVTCAGLGAKLMQYDTRNDCKQLITYISKPFNEAECNYPMINQQILSVVWALRKVRHFVEGCECEVFTDRSVLAWYKSRKRMSRRLNQWAKILSKYNITLRHCNTDEEET